MQANPHRQGAPVTRSRQPIGVVLAGGSGTRMGGAKVTVALRGRPLLCYPIDALRSVVADVAVISKAEVVLPQLDGVMVWIEPDAPRHPFVGVVEALALAGGRPVLVCPVDFPFLSSELLVSLLSARAEDHPAVLAAAHGVPRPLLGCYQPAAAPLLSEAIAHGTDPEDALEILHPALLEVVDETQLVDVDTPDDLLQAAAMLDRLRPLLRS